MKFKKMTALILTAVLSIASLAGCGGAGNATAEEASAPEESAAPEAAAASGERIVTLGWTTAWDSLMPYNSASGSTWNALMLDKVFDRLAYGEINGSAFSGRGASSWEAADDHMAIIFHLDEKATWSDGEPVTADDWIYTFELITDPAFLGTSRGDMFSIAGTDDSGILLEGETLGAEKVDDYTIKLTLKDATEPEEWLLAHNRQIYVLPKHCLEGIAVGDILSDSFWTAPVGSGPCRFVSEVIGSEMILDARPEYQLGAPGFDQLRCLVVDSANSLNAIVGEDIDLVTYGNQISSTSVALAQDQGLTVNQMEQPNFFIEVLLNNSSITDPMIRKALWMALDVETITSFMNDGYGMATDTYILPGNEYRNEDLSVDYDPAAAKDLLDKSSYAGETYTMACGSSREELVSLMKQYFDAIGFNMEIQLVDVATMFSGLQEGKYDMGVSGHTPTASPVWFNNASSFHVLAGAGVTPYRVTDEKLGSYYNEINATFDKDAKIALVKEYQAYLAESVPFIPLWFMNVFYIEAKSVSGVDYGGATMCNDNVWNWNKA